jgi:hypothetical protein
VLVKGNNNANVTFRMFVATGIGFSNVLDRDPEPSHWLAAADRVWCPAMRKPHVAACGWQRLHQSARPEFA